MMRTVFLSVVCLLTLTSAALAQEADPASVDLPADLDRVLRDYEAGWQAEDEAALAGLFTPDGYILRPGHAPVQGRAAIQEAYKNSGGGLLLRAFDFATEGGVGYILGGYRYSQEGPDTGKFILTLKKVDDRWYISADMDNGNRRG